MRTKELDFYDNLNINDYVWVISNCVDYKYRHKNEDLPVLIRTKLESKNGYYSNINCFNLKFDKINAQGIYYNLNNCFIDEKLAKNKYSVILKKCKKHEEEKIFEIDYLLNKN